MTRSASSPGPPARSGRGQEPGNLAAGERAPVLIVGAGPAGLTTAIALARYGVQSVLVERRPVLSGLPRAVSVSMRTMELLRSWGLEQQIRAGGVDVDWRQWTGPTLAATGEARPTSFPTAEQSMVLSPAAPASQGAGCSISRTRSSERRVMIWSRFWRMPAAMCPRPWAPP